MECVQKQYHHEAYANDIDLMVNHLKAALRAAFFYKKKQNKKDLRKTVILNSDKCYQI